MLNFPTIAWKKSITYPSIQLVCIYLDDTDEYEWQMYSLVFLSTSFFQILLITSFGDIIFFYVRLCLQVATSVMCKTLWKRTLVRFIVIASLQAVKQPVLHIIFNQIPCKWQTICLFFTGCFHHSSSSSFF